jgi:hypothetical protein
MSGRRRFICPNGFHRAMRLCFRAFDAVKLMTSGVSPIAQMSGAVSKDRRPSRLKTSTWAETVVAPNWRARKASHPQILQMNQMTCKSSNRPCWTKRWTYCWTFFDGDLRRNYSAASHAIVTSEGKLPGRRVCSAQAPCCPSNGFSAGGRYGIPVDMNHSRGSQGLSPRARSISTTALVGFPVGDSPRGSQTLEPTTIVGCRRQIGKQQQYWLICARNCLIERLAALGAAITEGRSSRPGSHGSGAGLPLFGTLRVLKFCGCHRPSAAKPGAAAGGRLDHPARNVVAVAIRDGGSPSSA